MDLGKMIRVTEAAQRLGVTVGAVYQAIGDTENPITGAKCGSAWWVVEESIANYTPRNYPRGEREE